MVTKGESEEGRSGSLALADANSYTEWICIERIGKVFFNIIYRIDVHRMDKQQGPTV